MSKVQVDTIVDKDDISAPSLTKGAIVTGVCTATSFDGAISEWVLGANGSSDYTFTGSGLTGAENDPTLYLKRGQKYRFKNSSGGHPFRIQSTANGSTGTAYNDGVTNNDAGNGTTLEWDVQFDAPSVLYYQCTSHGSMGGKIYIGNSGNSATLVDLNVSGVTTTGSVVSGAISGSTGTFTGDVSIADKIIHTGDTDTAIRFSDANQISAETGGSERLRIDSAGILKLYGDGSDNSVIYGHRAGSLSYILGNQSGSDDFNIKTWASSTNIIFSTAGNNEKVRITTAGKVGIGTTIPTRSFDVRGDATIGIDQHSGNPGTTVGILTVRGHHVNSDSEYAQLYLANSNSSGGSTASIRGNRDATSNFATSLSFFTNHNVAAGNGEERLRVGTTGQIGLSAGGVGVAATDYGTSGQVLTSGGASATATWADAGGGQWTLLENVTSTSNVQTLDTLGGANGLTQYSGTYKFFKIAFFFSRADNTINPIGLRISTDGSTYVAINYRMEETWLHGGSLAYTQHGNDNRYKFCSTQDRSNYMGEVTFYDPFNTTRNKLFTTRMSGNRDDGSADFMTGHSSMSNYASNNAITGIQLFTDGSSYGNPFQYAFYAHA